MTDKKKKEMEGLAYGMRMELAKCKNDYIRHTINGRYFLARCNMLAVQIQTGEIKESLDGCKKTEEMMRAEYALQKMQAINEMRNSFFAKKDLIEKYKLTEEDILKIEEDYYDGKIVRETYDESYKRGKEAKFVNPPKD